MKLHPSFRLSLALALMLCLTRAAGAAPYFESALGDISGVPAAPSSWSLEPGGNSLSGSAGGGDVDLLHVVVPAGHALTSLILDDYSDDVQTVSFIGVASGPVWPTGVEYDVEALDIMGWVHFGTAAGASVGDDLLPPMSVAEFSPGFTLPLPAGNYTFDIQDVDFPMSYAMTFVVTPVPEPAVVAMIVPLALALRLVARWRPARG